MKTPEQVFAAYVGLSKDDQKRFEGMRYGFEFDVAKGAEIVKAPVRRRGRPAGSTNKNNAATQAAGEAA